MKPEKPTQHDANQGEGDRSAARHYGEQLREFVGAGKVVPAARAAEAYVEQHPVEAARAERTARRGPSTAQASLGDLITAGIAVVERARPIVERALGRLRARLGRE